jgi:hypothetical protein
MTLIPVVIPFWMTYEVYWWSRCCFKPNQYNAESHTWSVLILRRVNRCRQFGVQADLLLKCVPCDFAYFRSLHLDLLLIQMYYYKDIRLNEGTLVNKRLKICLWTNERMNVYCKDAQIFRKSRSHLETLGTRRGHEASFVPRLHKYYHLTYVIKSPKCIISQQSVPWQTSCSSSAGRRPDRQEEVRPKSLSGTLRARQKSPCLQK